MSIASRISSMEEHVTNAYNGLQGLGADLTGIDKNIDNIASVLDNIYDDLPKVTGSGTSITLDDTRVGKIKSTLKGNTSQTGTPTPTSPQPVNVVSGDNKITVCGKNFLDLTGITARTVTAGITITPNFNGDLLQNIKISGTPTTTAWQTLKRVTLNAGTYILNGLNLTGSQYYGFRFGIYIDSSTQYFVNTNTPTVTFTISESKTVDFVIWVQDKTYYPTTDVYIYPMIRLASETDDTYEPYQGNTYNIDLPVENLFNKETAQLNVGINTSNGNTYGDTNLFSTDYIPISINTTYIANSASTTGNRVFGACYDSNKSFLEAVSTGVGERKFTVTNANAKYVRITGQKVNIDTYQLEKGSKANTYTPYGTTPIELCSSKDGTYRDSFIYNKTNDKWYLHKEIKKRILNGGEAYSVAATPSGKTVFLLNDQRSDTYHSNSIVVIISTHLEGIADSQGNLLNSIRANNSGQIFITTSSDYPDVATFKTFLSANNITFYYILATPTNTEITYQPLIDQLNLLEKAMSKDGQTNISQVNNDLPFIISASALKEWSV